MMKRCLAIVFIPLLLFHAIYSDSLIPDGFSGYLGAEGALSAGTIVRILIDTETRMQYNAAMQQSGMVSLQFTGGEGDGLLNFLPGGTNSSTAQASSEEESLLSTQLAARVVEIDDNGNVYLEGSREIGIERSRQRVVVSGWANPADVTEEGMISFDSLADSVLTFQTLLSGAAPVIGPDDLEEVRTPVPAAEPEPEPIEGEVPATVTGAELEVDEPADQEGVEFPEPETVFQGYTLRQESRRNLLLQYINQMLDLLFEPAAQ